MTDRLTDVIVVLNTVANALGRLLAPIGVLPGWVSATLVALGSGVGLLVIFKNASNQRAIKRVRRDIRANRLASALFRDSLWLGLRSQGRVVFGALRLLALAIVPLLVMGVPVALLIGQLSLWYQARPLPVDGETTVTLFLAGAAGSPMPDVTLEPGRASRTRADRCACGASARSVGPLRGASRGPITCGFTLTTGHTKRTWRSETGSCA